MAVPRREFSTRLLPRLLRQTRVGDYCVAGLFLVLASLSFWLNPAGHQNAGTAPGRNAHVQVGERLAVELNLARPDTIWLQGAYGLVSLEVAAGGIRVLSSTCPNQFCVRQGTIGFEGQLIVCVPNRLVITIASNNRTNLNAITY